MSLLKKIGKFFGGVFVLLGLTIFIMSCFGGYAVGNVNVLEEDLSNNMNQIIQTPEMEEINKLCEQIPEDENCVMLNNNLNKNPILDTIEKEISEFSVYGQMMKIFGIVFFIIGLLLFVWCNGWLSGLRATSLVTFIGVVFSYFYYKTIITSALNSFLPEEILTIVNNWVVVSLNQTLSLILILGVTFLILTIGLYILKRKLSNEPLKKTFTRKEGKK